MQQKLRVPQPIRSEESLDRPGGFADYGPRQIDAKTLFWGDGGKKHYGPKSSQVESWHPGRRTLHPNHSGYAKPTGLRSIPIPVPHVPPRAEQRHMLNEAARSGFDVPEHSIEKALNRKVLVKRDDGRLARDFISTEVTLDVQFGVKKKCDGGIRQKMNGIPVANPGDKLYSAVEYSPGFYKEFNSSFSRVGGRLGTGGDAHDVAPPGEAKRQAMERDTSMGFNPAAMTNTMGRKDTLNFRPRLSYEERMRIKQTKEAIEEVTELTDGVVTAMNEEGLSWEQRTGLYVYKTKKEEERIKNAEEEAERKKKAEEEEKKEIAEEEK